jgi:hypothetical protein
LASSSNTGNLWSNQETATSIYVFQSGVYSLQVINSNGCSSQSDPIVITVLPNPNASIVASGSTVICEGDNVTLTSSPASFYFWSNGNTNQSIIVSSSGLYSVMVTGNNGCSSNTQPVSVTVNDPSFSTLNESALDAYSLNGTTYTQSGTYTQVLTNAAGCDSTITLNLTLSFTGLGDNLQGIRIFPNPANDVLQIESTSALNGVFRIYDATGRMVLKGDFTGTNTNIDVRNLAPGTYTFQATNWTERIVVIRR